MIDRMGRLGFVFLAAALLFGAAGCAVPEKETLSPATEEAVSAAAAAEPEEAWAFPEELDSFAVIYRDPGSVVNDNAEFAEVGKYIVGAELQSLLKREVLTEGDRFAVQFMFAVPEYEKWALLPLFTAWANSDPEDQQKEIALWKRYLDPVADRIEKQTGIPVSRRMMRFTREGKAACVKRFYIAYLSLRDFEDLSREFADPTDCGIFVNLVSDFVEWREQPVELIPPYFRGMHV